METTAVQIGQTARDCTDLCRSLKTNTAVFLHDDGIVQHSGCRNNDAGALLGIKASHRSIAHLDLAGEPCRAGCRPGAGPLRSHRPVSRFVHVTLSDFQLACTGPAHDDPPGRKQRPLAMCAVVDFRAATGITTCESNRRPRLDKIRPGLGAVTKLLTAIGESFCE